MALLVALGSLPGCASSAGPVRQESRAESRGTLAKRFANQTTSEHLVLHHDADVSGVPALVRFAEGFIDLVGGRFFRAKLPARIDVFLLKDRESFQAFLREELGEDDPPDFGMFLPEIPAIATYQDSGLGTFAHEIVHAFMLEGLPGAPAWAREGLPSFFEKFFGYWDGEALALHLGYQNPWRIDELGGRLTTLSLASIVHQPDLSGTNADGVGTSEERLVSVFLYRHGVLGRFIDLTRRRETLGFATGLEAAFGRDLHAIEPDWKAYLREIASNRDAALAVPVSQVLPDKAAFRAFMRSEGLSPDTQAAVRGVDD